MKTFTETLHVVGDYYSHPRIDNPDVIIDAYEMPLAGRHVSFIRIFTQKQLAQSNYKYDWQFECTDEESFFDGLESVGEWFVFNSLVPAASDLDLLIRRGIVVEAQAEALTTELLRRAA